MANVAMLAVTTWMLGAGLAVVVAVLLWFALLAAFRMHATGAPSQARGLSWLAVVVLLAALALAVLAALDDAGRFGPRDLYLASVMASSAIVALCALARALQMLTIPKTQRTANHDYVSSLLFLVAFGVGSCYALLVMPR